MKRSCSHAGSMGIGTDYSDQRCFNATNGTTAEGTRDMVSSRFLWAIIASPLSDHWLTLSDGVWDLACEMDRGPGKTRAKQKQLMIILKLLFPFISHRGPSLAWLVNVMKLNKQGVLLCMQISCMYISVIARLGDIIIGNQLQGSKYKMESWKYEQELCLKWRGGQIRSAGMEKGRWKSL